jgi:hypothetical protein
VSLRIVEAWNSSVAFQRRKTEAMGLKVSLPGRAEEPMMGAFDRFWQLMNKPP